MWNRRRHCGGHGCDRRIGQFLDPTLLLLLKQAPAHGYALLSRTAEFGLAGVPRAKRDLPRPS